MLAGSAILLQSHIQVVVRRPAAIIGLFRPRGFSAWRGESLASSMGAGHDP